MARAIALTRQLSTHSVEALRVAIVSGCAAALIAAGQFSPF